MLEHRIAQHGVEGGVGEPRHGIGVALQDLEIGGAMRPVERQADLRRGPGQRRQVQQRVGAGQEARLRSRARGLRPRAGEEQGGVGIEPRIGEHDGVHRFSRASPERWCGRRDSNPHSLAGSGFSYHFGFRRRLSGVRGLDYPFAIAARALGAARLVSTPSPLPGLARDWHVEPAFPDFERFCSAGFPAGTPIVSLLRLPISPRPHVSSAGLVLPQPDERGESNLHRGRRSLRLHPQFRSASL